MKKLSSKLKLKKEIIKDLVNPMASGGTYTQECDTDSNGDCYSYGNTCTCMPVSDYNGCGGGSYNTNDTSWMWSRARGCSIRC